MLASPPLSVQEEEFMSNRPRIRKKKKVAAAPRLSIIANMTDKARRAALLAASMLGENNPVRYWIMAQESDAEFLTGLGIELGQLQVDGANLVKRAHGLVVWGKCRVPDLTVLDEHWSDRCVWGPDVSSKISEDYTKAQGGKPKVFDWATFRRDNPEAAASKINA